MDFLQLWLHGRPPTTRRQYARIASGFLDGAAKPLREVTLRDLQLYVDRIAARSQKVSTIRTAVYTLKSLSRFAFRINHVERDLAELLHVPPSNTNPSERVLSEEKTWALIAAPRSQRHRVLLRTLYKSGARVSEISRLRYGDLAQHENGGGLLWITRKGGRRDAVWIPPELLAELRSLMPTDATPATYVFRSQGSDGPLRPRGIARMVERYARRVLGKNAPRVSPHWLRHCHATHAIARGAPLELVQRTLGHSTLTHTAVYLHPASGDSSARFLG